MRKSIFALLMFVVTTTSSAQVRIPAGGTDIGGANKRYSIHLSYGYLWLPALQYRAALC